MKRQSKRSKRSAGYKLWHLLSIKSIHHIAQENNARWVTVKRININASEWYKPQVDITVFYSEKPLFSFLQWHYLKIHCQLLLFFIRIKKIQASALIISQTDHKIVLVILLWRHQLASAPATLWPLSSCWMFCWLKYYLYSKPSPKISTCWSAQHSIQAVFYLKTDNKISDAVDTLAQDRLWGREKGSWCVRCLPLSL